MTRCSQRPTLSFSSSTSPLGVDGISVPRTGRGVVVLFGLVPARNVVATADLLPHAKQVEVRQELQTDTLAHNCSLRAKSGHGRRHPGPCAAQGSRPGFRAEARIGQLSRGCLACSHPSRHFRQAGRTRRAWKRRTMPAVASVLSFATALRLTGMTAGMTASRHHGITGVGGHRSHAPATHRPRRALTSSGLRRPARASP